MQNDTRKTLVTLAIEKTLLEINKIYLEKFESMIYEKHRCPISDCYEHPEYLNEVLKEIFGNSYREIIASIEKYLNEFAYQYPIEQFLQKIKH